MVKRSFDGCWTCRLRKVKCDLQKPKCQRCSRRNEPCHYGVKLTWVQTQSIPSNLKPQTYFKSNPIEVYNGFSPSKPVQRSKVDFVSWARPYKTYEDLDMDLEFDPQVRDQEIKGPFTVFRAPVLEKKDCVLSNMEFLLAGDEHLEFPGLQLDSPAVSEGDERNDVEVKDWLAPSLENYKIASLKFEEKFNDIDDVVLQIRQTFDEMKSSSVIPTLVHFKYKLLPKLCSWRNNGMNFWEKIIWNEEFDNMTLEASLKHPLASLFLSFDSFNCYWQHKDDKLIQLSVKLRCLATSKEKDLRSDTFLPFYLAKVQFDSSFGLDTSDSFSKLLSKYPQLQCSNSLFPSILDNPASTASDQLLQVAAVMLVFHSSHCLDISRTEPLPMFTEPMGEDQSNRPKINLLAPTAFQVGDFVTNTNIPVSLQKHISNEHIYRQTAFNIDANYELDDSEDPPPPSFEIVFGGKSHSTLEAQKEAQDKQLDFEDPAHSIELSLGVPISLAQLLSSVTQLVRHQTYSVTRNVYLPRYHAVLQEVESRLLRWKIPWKLYYDDQGKKVFYSLNHEIFFHNAMALYYAVLTYYFTSVKDLPSELLQQLIVKALSSFESLKYVLRDMPGRKYSSFRPKLFSLFVAGAEACEESAQNVVKEIVSFYEDAYQHDHFSNGWGAKQTIYEVWRLRKEGSPETCWVDVVRQCRYPMD